MSITTKLNQINDIKTDLSATICKYVDIDEFHDFKNYSKILNALVNGMTVVQLKSIDNISKQTKVVSAYVNNASALNEDTVTTIDWLDGQISTFTGNFTGISHVYDFSENSNLSNQCFIISDTLKECGFAIQDTKQQKQTNQFKPGNNLTCISQYGLYYTNMTYSSDTFKIPEGIVKLDSNAINSLNSVKTLIIPSTLSNDTNTKGMFNKPNSIMERIEVDERNKHYYTINNNKFLVDKQNGELVKSAKIEDEDLTITNVKSIGNGAFTDMKSIKHIITDDVLEYIGNSAFQNCTSLESIAFGNGFTTLMNSPFYNCTSLKRIKLPRQYAELNYQCFRGITNLELLDLSDCIGVTKETDPAYGIVRLGSSKCFDLITADFKILVPPDKIDKYKSANIWKDLDPSKFITAI